MLWPGAWKSPDALELLRGTSIDCLICADRAIAGVARQAGFHVVVPGQWPEGVTMLEGMWPGIRLARFGASNTLSAGPTGDPWVNSNIWPVRLAQARRPGTTVWLRAHPANQRYSVTIADAAITGARWIVNLDDALASALLERKAEALPAWNSISATAAYFAKRRIRMDYEPQAVLGILSEFATSQSHEVLNLITRSGQQYRVIPTEPFDGASLKSLRALLFADAKPPTPSVRAALRGFVDQGGLLIASKPWGAPHSAKPDEQTHPRFTLFQVGKGTLALAKSDLNDPYLLASDAAILVSHRYDLLRFWNGGALSAYYSASRDKTRGLVQILFYADRPSDDVTVRIAGNYTSAQLSTLEDPEPQPVHSEPQPGALEIHLPRVTRYAALELT